MNWLGGVKPATVVCFFFSPQGITLGVGGKLLNLSSVFTLPTVDRNDN